MSIVTTLRREQWERGNRFEQVEDYTDAILVVEPAGGEWYDDPENWELYYGPPPAMRYELWRRRELRDGGGWELTETGDDHIDADQLKEWKKWVGEIIGNTMDVEQLVGLRLYWPTNNGRKLIVEQTTPPPSWATEEDIRPLLQVRMDRVANAIGFIGRENQEGFESVSPYEGRRRIFVWEASDLDRRRGHIEHAIHAAIGFYDPKLGQYAVRWLGGDVQALSVQVYGALVEAEERVQQALVAAGYTLTEPWADGRGVFARSE